MPYRFTIFKFSLRNNNIILIITVICNKEGSNSECRLSVQKLKQEEYNIGHHLTNPSSVTASGSADRLKGQQK